MKDLKNNSLKADKKNMPVKLKHITVIPFFIFIVFILIIFHFDKALTLLMFFLRRMLTSRLSFKAGAAI